MARTKFEIHVYMPYKLWEQLRKLAEKNRRSVTAEAVIAIESHLRGQRKQA